MIDDTNSQLSSDVLFDAIIAKKWYHEIAAIYPWQVVVSKELDRKYHRDWFAADISKSVVIHTCYALGIGRVWMFSKREHLRLLTKELPTHLVLKVFFYEKGGDNPTENLQHHLK